MTTSSESAYLSPKSPSGRQTVQALIAANAPLLPSHASRLDSLDNSDPISFLNKHYGSESVLSSQLPALRLAVVDRMDQLDDRIANALQRQSETAAATRKHVQDAKASVAELENRIQQIKSKASQSETAVLEITKDMKRLDCAKKHLQRTITTLKRLHMLVHAVEQLRQTTYNPSGNVPDYKAAAHLVEATRLLLGHFSGYTQKVLPMRQLEAKVQSYQEKLRLGLVLGFRIVSFGEKKALEMNAKSKKLSLQDDEEEPRPVMSVEVMQGGVLFFDALGDTVRAQFIHEFCQDHLGHYLQEFEPPSRSEPKQEKRVSSFKVVEAKPEPETSQASLDQLEKRFTWFRDVLEQMNKKFKEVFPQNWNLQATMAGMFLQLVSDMC